MNRRPLTDQQMLDFMPPSQDRQAAIADPVVACGIPVAGRIHRMLANVLDISMVVMALGLFLLVFSLGGGDVVLNRQTLPLFAFITVVLGLFYRFLFCFSGADTPGMRWAQLRLMNFDGYTPSHEQRTYRLLGSCLSLLAAGLGLLWALVDEETLTWHDHMSKTFPTPHRSAESRL
ncbi:MAG TPA: RDD family protein [Bryobacteraceae bacterium]|nr:RDD family protein [Bryobacteraceae bacterium]